MSTHEPVALAPAPAPPAAAPAAPTALPDAAVFSAAPPAAAVPAPVGSPAASWLAGRVGLDWLSWSITSLVATAFFVLIVSGRVVTEGPVLLVLTRTHGIHEGDLFALAAACGSIALPVLRGLRRR